jgi:hypothetical protein
LGNTVLEHLTHKWTWKACAARPDMIWFGFCLLPHFLLHIIHLCINKKQNTELLWNWIQLSPPTVVQCYNTVCNIDRAKHLFSFAVLTYTPIYIKVCLQTKKIHHTQLNYEVSYLPVY